MWIDPKIPPLELSVSALDTVEQKLVSSLQDSQSHPSLFVRSKAIPLQSHLRKCKKDKFHLALCSQISPNFVVNPMRDTLISLQQAFPVNLFRWQERKKESKTPDIFFQTSLELSKSANQKESFLKMSSESYRPKQQWVNQYCFMSYDNWNKEVTHVRGEYSRQNKLVQDIREKESTSSERGQKVSSWATPNTMDYLPPKSVEAIRKQQEGHRKGRTRPSNLREQVDAKTMSMYPTPRTSDGEGGRVKTIKVDGTWRSVRKKSNQLFGAKLRDAIETEAQEALPEEFDNYNYRLNPDWVEKLMGLPRGYTSLDWDGKAFVGSWEDDSWEEVPRVIPADESENRIDRIRMLGNGICPQTAALAWRTLNNKLGE